MTIKSVTIVYFKYQNVFCYHFPTALFQAARTVKISTTDSLSACVLKSRCFNNNRKP